MNVAIEMAEGKPPFWEMAPYQVINHIPKQPPPKLKGTCIVCAIAQLINQFNQSIISVNEEYLANSYSRAG